MKKIYLSLLLLLSFSTLANASYLFDKDYPLCIEDYYIKGGDLYYLRSSDNTWTSTSENNVFGFIYSGFSWNSDDEICQPQEWLILGMDVKDWHFLEALTGLLIGIIIMFYTIELFMKVGGKR